MQKEKTTQTPVELTDADRDIPEAPQPVKAPEIKGVEVTPGAVKVTDQASSNAVGEV